MALVDESSEALMGRVHFGEREPLSILLRRFANPLLTLIRRLGVNVQQSEEVFLAVWTHRKNYDRRRTFRSWLFGIAANKCKISLRQSRTSQPLDQDVRWTGVGAAPVEGLIQSEISELVAKAVSQLPLRQREVVVMRLWNDMSYSEIATALDRSESTIRTNMFVGLESLRKFLEPRMRE